MHGDMYRTSQKDNFNSCYSFRVNWEDFTYPLCGTPLVEAFGGRFEAVFVLLHPFVRMPQTLAWSRTHRYPEDAEVREFGKKCTWSEIATEAHIASWAQLNRSLLTSIGSLTDYLANPAGCDRLQAFLQSNSIWMPTEGRFEPLLQPDILQIFAASDAEEALFVQEFPDEYPVTRLPVEKLAEGTIPFPRCGTLLAPDGTFLFTVDWDSFFTLLYGPRALIDEAVKALRLEGFFASANTDHAWWTYSLGCATATMSPEHWQTVSRSSR